MNISPLSTLALTAFLAATPYYSQPVNAGNGLQRCQSKDGAVMYTDKACGALGAQSTPISGALMARIAREEALSEADSPAVFDQGNFVVAPAGRRSASGGCARTPTQLAMDLRGAFALGDVNRIAESYYWTGLSNTEGQRIMARLEKLPGQRVTDMDYFNAQIQAGAGGYEVAASSNSYGGNAGVMQVRFGSGASTSITDFDVERYSDCYFVRF